MNNEEILKRRWKNTDKILRDSVKGFRDIEQKTLDKLIDIFNTLDITYQELNKPISKKDKRLLDNKIKEAKKNGLYTPYLVYLLAKNNNTYANLLEILIYLAYLEQQIEIESSSKEVYVAVANDIYKQALDEIPNRYKPKKFSLTWEFIYSMLWVPVYSKPIKEYLEMLSVTAEQEAYKQGLVLLQQNKDIKEDDLRDLLRKQMNRIICINDDKFSGVLNDTSRLLGNEVYTKPFTEEKLQVRFIAEMDDKTTKMCEGMNNMLFYVNDWNRFYRYSDVDKKDVYYVVKGLEPGINLPPINNHFHWCRSTITYLINTPIKK